MVNLQIVTHIYKTWLHKRNVQKCLIWYNYSLSAYKIWPPKISNYLIKFYFPGEYI